MLSQVLKEQPIREPNTLWKCLLSATDISFPSAAIVHSVDVGGPLGEITDQWMLVVHQERSQTGISLDIRPDSSAHTCMAAFLVVNMASVHSLAVRFAAGYPIQVKITLHIVHSDVQQQERMSHQRQLVASNQLLHVDHKIHKAKLCSYMLQPQSGCSMNIQRWR